MEKALNEERKKKKTRTRTTTMRVKYGQQQHSQLHEISHKTGGSNQNAVAIN
jgi:hypothetical protein